MAQGRMPKALLRYWRGEGMARIRPGTHGAFDRCVRIFRGYGVRDPKGTCANLIKNETGKWPGEHRNRRAALVAGLAGQYDGMMIALLPSEQSAIRYALEGGVPASDMHVTLAYAPDAAAFDDMDRDEILDDMEDFASIMAPFTADAFSANLFNPAGEEPCLVLGMSGPPVQFAHRYASHLLDGAIEPTHEPYAAHMTLAYGQPNELMAMSPATGPVEFDRVRVAFGNEVYDIPLGEDMDEMTASVNSSTWSSVPMAPREQEYNADAAITRIKEWAGGSVEKFRKAFLWYSPDNPTSTDSYRLPIGDIVNGKLTLVPRAIFSAAAILSGAHGGLEGVVSDEEKKKLRGIVSQIYDVFREDWGDPRQVPPWERGGNEREEVTASMEEEEMDLTASVNSAGWSSMPIASMDRPWSKGEATARVWSWAEENFGKYRKAFLWYDAANPEQKGSYKLPIADVIDGELTIVPRAVNAVAAVLGGARGGVDIPDADMDRVQSIVDRIQKRMHGDEADAQTAAAPLAPPREWFTHTASGGLKPLTVTADGRVSGYLAGWRTCHTGYPDRCITPPKSRTDYNYFKSGQVLTADGGTVRVGKITMDTGHADINVPARPTIDHYDNTGTQIAAVNIGEDEHGIWVAGAVVPGATEEQIARLRLSPLSGDWRRIDGALELVAALAVNAPGYPIMASIGEAEPDALVSVGIVTGDGEVANEAIPEPQTEADEALLKRLDSLDESITEIMRRSRATRYAALMASVDKE